MEKLVHYSGIHFEEDKVCSLSFPVEMGTSGSIGSRSCHFVFTIPKNHRFTNVICVCHVVFTLSHVNVTCVNCKTLIEE